MAIATLKNGKLIEITGKYPDCYVQIGIKKIYMDILPDISDSKSADYQTESGIARASPFNIYKYSSIRTISWTCHFIIQSSSSNDDTKSVDKLIENIRILQSACYPSTEDGHPPPICHLKCGDLLDSKDGVCAVLKSYSLKFDTSVPWDESTLIPYKVDMDLQFDVVYNQESLPTSNMILESGY